MKTFVAHVDQSVSVQDKPETEKTKTYVARISVKPTFLVHVLDTTTGQPACTLPVTLYEQTRGKGWDTVDEGLTSDDGQIRLLKGRPLNSGGRYKLHLDIGGYYQGKDGSSIYPFIEIGLQVPSDCKNLHVSIHMSKHGYATYIGT